MARNVAERIMELAQVAHQAEVDSLKSKREENLEKSRMRLQVTLYSHAPRADGGRRTQRYRSRLAFAGDGCGNIRTETGRGKLVFPTKWIPLVAGGLVDDVVSFDFQELEVCDSSKVELWTARRSKRSDWVSSRTVAPLSPKAFDYNQLKAVCIEMLESAVNLQGKECTHGAAAASQHA